MGRKTVLLVDDNPANLKLVVDCLERHSLEVAVAKNGEEALQRLHRTHLVKPDLILLDVMMPGIDGYETCRRIRSSPGLKNIPIIFLSALSDTSNMVSGFSMGGVDYIKKPINLPEMMARINTHLELSELRNQLDDRIKIRTQELIDANNSLRLEMEERKRAEEQIKYIATHDALTDLPNRVLLEEYLYRLIAKAHQRNEQVVLILLDLDQFKSVNDSLGHQVGDMLLSDVACRLKNVINNIQSAGQGEGIVTRLGGDEFVVCLHLYKESDDAESIAKILFDSLREPFKNDGQNLHIGASVGIAVYPDDGMDANTLMRNAGAAMYHAKQSGRAEIRRYSAEMNEKAQNHLNLSSLLAAAIENKELFMEYQPQVDLKTGTIIGAEALMRWRRRDGTLISPAEFIPVAEANGMIKEMGEWGLRQSCAELKRWHNAGYNDLAMSVNISVPQIHSACFAEGISDIVDEFQLPPSMLELEITESLLMQHSKTNLNTLHHLSKFGVRLSIDDFGTGYSSLAYLQDFPVNALKIDMSFVRNIGSERGNAIPSAIIAMAHSLHMKVVAEGIETDAQEAFLQFRGCDFAQGFYYGRSMSGEKFLDVCRSNQVPGSIGSIS